MKWLADKILQIIDRRTKIKILVHEAFFVGKNEPFYFVQVSNLSPENIFTITHVWVADGEKDLDVLNPSRPLPHKLDSSDIWETWFPKSIIINNNNIFKNVRIKLSNGKIYKSKKNLTIRPVGFVA